MANQKIQEIEGVGPASAEKLGQAGIVDTDGLLEACGDRGGRAKVAEKTGLSEKQLLEWTNMADLFRIRGVGSEYAELLEAAGVDTVKELAQRNPANLAAAMASVNREKKLARRVPTDSMVETWVTQAKDLPARISH